MKKHIYIILFLLFSNSLIIQSQSIWPFDADHSPGYPATARIPSRGFKIPHERTRAVAGKLLESYLLNTPLLTKYQIKFHNDVDDLFITQHDMEEIV